MLTPWADRPMPMYLQAVREKKNQKAPDLNFKISFFWPRFIVTALTFIHIKFDFELFSFPPRRSFHIQSGSEHGGSEVSCDILKQSYKDKLLALSQQKQEKNLFAQLNKSWILQLSASGARWGHHLDSNNKYLVRAAWTALFTSFLHFIQ